jgi:hypothetical protein
MSCAKLFVCSLLSLLLVHASHAQSLPIEGKTLINWHVGKPITPVIVQYSGKLTDQGIEGTVNADDKDTAFITTPVGMLDVYRRYLLTVTYRVLESPVDSDDAGARGFLAMRTDTPNTTWVPSTWIREAAHQTRTRTIDYLLPEGITGYTFNIGVEKAGRIVVTSLKLIAMPRITDNIKRDVTDLPTPDFGNRPYEPFGICQHLPWKYFYKTDEQIKQAVAQLKDMGVQVARTGITWQTLQPKSKDQWEQSMIDRYDTMINALAEAGIKNHIILHASPKWTSTNPDSKNFWRYMPRDMEALKDYVRFITKRYGKHIDSYEIVNEPDLKGFWESSIEDYMTWSKVVVKVIREEDPTAFVLSGSLTDAGLWGLKDSDSFALQTMIDNGLGDTFDGLAVHTYAPNTELSIYQINHWYSQLVQAGLSRMPIWITEIGRSTFTHSDGTVTTEQEQADMLYKTYTQLIQHPAVEKIFWYNYREKGFQLKSSPREAGFGIVREDFTPKPAFEVYRTLPRPSQKPYDMQLLAVDRQRMTQHD